MFGDDMYNNPFPLQLSGHPYQPCVHDYRAEFLKYFWPDDKIGDACFVFQRDKNDAAGGAWPLTNQRDPGDRDARAVPPDDVVALVPGARAQPDVATPY